MQLTAGEAKRRPRVVAFLRQPLIANAFFIWADQALGAIGGFAFWILVARLYTSRDVGLGSVTLAAVTLIGSLGHMGLGMGLIRFLPSAGGGRNHLLNVALTLTTLTGTAAAVIFLLGLPLWSPKQAYLTDRWDYAAGFVVFATGMALYTVVTMAYVALRSARYLFWLGALGQVVRIALPAGLIFLGGAGIVLAGGVSTLAALGLGIALLVLVAPGYRPLPAFSAKEVSLLLPFGAANHAADLAGQLPRLILPLIVVNVLNAESGAHFYIGFFLAALLLTAVQSLATSLFAEGSHDEAALMRSARHALVISLGLSTAGALVMLLAGGWLLLIFGREYSDEATGLLRLIAATAIPASVTFVYLAILKVRRQMARLLIVSWTIAVVSVALSYLLIPSLGIAGPGVGMLVGQALGVVVALIDLARPGRARGSAPDKAASNRSQA